jgi:hypothetical protein
MDSQVPVEVRLAALAWKSEHDICVLFVPYELQHSNPNRTRGRHWKQAEAASDTAHAAALWAYREADDPVNAEPVHVDYLVFRERVLDDDNAVAALKPVRDALFKGRLAPDDSTRYVRNGEVRFITGARWRPNNAWVAVFVRRR